MMRMEIKMRQDSLNSDHQAPGDDWALPPGRLAGTPAGRRTPIAAEPAEVRADDPASAVEGIPGPGAAQAGGASLLDLSIQAVSGHQTGAMTSWLESSDAVLPEGEGPATPEIPMTDAEDVERAPSPAPSLLPPALSIVGAGDMLSPAREITATTPSAKILFTRDDLDTTYVSGRRGMMVLSLVEDGTSYRVGRYDVESGEWRILSKGWPRFGNALAFACTIVS